MIEGRIKYRPSILKKRVNLENKAFPAVKIQFMGKEREFKVTLQALADYQHVTGKNPLKGEFDTRDINEVIAFFWACLHAEDETLTQAEVAKHADVNCILTINRALGVSMPEPKEATPPLAPKPLRQAQGKSRTGSNFGRLVGSIWGFLSNRSGT